MESNIFVSAMEFVRNYFRRTQKELLIFKDTDTVGIIKVYVESIKQDTNLEMIEGLADIEKLSGYFKTNPYMQQFMNTLGFQLVCYLADDWTKLCKIMANAVTYTYNLTNSSISDLENIFQRHPWLVCVLIMRATDFADEDENKDLSKWKPKES